MLKDLIIQIKGTSPLLMSNGQGADQTNPFVVAIGKLTRKKPITEADILEIRKLEWYCSLYLDADNSPCIPGFVFEAMLKRSRVDVRGSKKQFGAGILCPLNAKIKYEGPRDLEQLFASGRFEFRTLVRIGTGKVTKSRAMFPEWEAAVLVQYENSLLSKLDVVGAADNAGKLGALMDWAGRYGRYEVIKVEEK